MANVKITDLTALSGALVGADLFEMVDDALGTPVSRKVTADVIRTYMDKRGGTIVRNDGSTTLSIATATFTKLTCINSEEYDPNSWWDNSATRFTPNRAGIYLAVAGTQITFSGYAASTPVSAIALIRKNGTDFAHLARGWLYDDAAGSLNLGVSGSCLVYLNGSTDYIEPFVWQNGGASMVTVAGAERQFFMAGFFSET